MSTALHIDPPPPRPRARRRAVRGHPRSRRQPAADPRRDRRARRLPARRDERRAQPRRRARGASRRRGAAARPVARGDRPHASTPIAAGWCSSGSRSTPPTRAARGHPQPRSTRACATARTADPPARGIHLHLGPELGHAQRTSIPSTTSCFRSAERKEMVVGEYADPATEDHEARALLRRRPPQHRRTCPTRRRPSRSSPATECSCPCTRRTWSATARPVDLAVGDLVHRRRPSGSASCTRSTPSSAPLHLSPSPPGRRPGVDRAKAAHLARGALGRSPGEAARSSRAQPAETRGRGLSDGGRWAAGARAPRTAARAFGGRRAGGRPAGARRSRRRPRGPAGCTRGESGPGS